MHENAFIIRRALDLGAGAYVAKSAEPSEVITAIDEILAGKTYVTPQYRQQVQSPDNPPLTSRELEIAVLAKQGFSNKQMAERLGLSVRTVESHLLHIYTKTGVGTKGEL